MSARDEIIVLLARHKGELSTDSSRLMAMFHATVEDLIAVGIDRGTVAEAAFSVGATWKLAVEGKSGAIRALRDVADLFEREVADRPYPDEARH